MCLMCHTDPPPPVIPGPFRLLLGNRGRSEIAPARLERPRDRAPHMPGVTDEQAQPMNRPLHISLRAAVLAVAVLSVAACVPIAAPEFGPGPPSMLAPKKAKTLGPAPVTGSLARFAFAPLNGVPGDKRLEMEADLKRFAATRGLSLVPDGDQTATYRVTGYLSAVGDATGTLLVYVWDVSDLNGTPLYRISGQEAAPGSPTDPWIGIQSAQVDDAARDTVDKLAEWVKG